MNRKYFRLVAVAAVLFAVHFVMLPAADARGLSGSRATVRSGPDGFDAVLAWMANLLPGRHTGHSANLEHVTSRDLSGGVYRVNTGSCLDPNGIPRCIGI
jgi:hypothetical protein